MPIISMTRQSNQGRIYHDVLEDWHASPSPHIRRINYQTNSPDKQGALPVGPAVAGIVDIYHGLYHGPY